MACHTQPQHSAAVQRGLLTQQQIYQMVSSDLMSCAPWSQSSRIAAQQDLPLQLTPCVEDLMQVCYMQSAADI